MNTKFSISKETKQLEKMESGNGWAACDIGNLDQITGYTAENTVLGIKVPAKIFLKDILNFTGAEISFGVLPAGIDYVSKHKHKENEEILIILSGEGKVLVDSEEIAVKEGSVIRISTGKVRAVKSTASKSVTYICIQVKENSLTNYTLTDAEMV